MIDVIESLMQGEDQYPRAFAAALPFWRDFYNEHEGADPAGLQDAIDESQTSFEWKMNETAGLTRPFAKSIMAITAIGALYRDGFEDEDFARRVVQCFIGSDRLSVDVKSQAARVKTMYGL